MCQDKNADERWLLAIDPGSDKVGYAVVNFNLTHGELGIVYLSEIHKVFARFCSEQTVKHPHCVVVGNGTACAVICRLFNSLKIDIPLKLFSEKNTTYNARARYFAENPPKGIWKYIPISLQSPPRPIDDYAAWLIGENFIKEYLQGQKQL